MLLYYHFLIDIRSTSAVAVGMAMQFLLSVLSEAIDRKFQNVSNFWQKKKAEAILRIYNLLIFMTLEEKECKRTNSLPNKLPVLVSRANFKCISPTKYITDLKPKHLGIN